jgi:hypothetical protein
MAKKRRPLRLDPQADLVQRLFGDVADIPNEEIDLVYDAIAPEEDATAAVRTLAQESANRYNRRSRRIPQHLEACGRSVEQPETRPSTAASPDSTPGGEAAARAPAASQEMQSLSAGENISDRDRKSIDELAEELERAQPGPGALSPAALLAGMLLDRFNIPGKPDLEALCRLLGLKVREKKFYGFDGILVRRENTNTGIIGVNSILASSHKRFTVAHEIGHFMIPYHRRLETVCQAGSIECFSTDLNSVEADANEFAVELLMPRSVVANRLELDTPSLARIGALAQEFDTSLIAATHRFLTLTDRYCAMVWSRKGRAVWYRTSGSLRSSLPLRDLPPAASMAGRLFVGKTVAPGMQPVDPYMWLSPSLAAQCGTLLEESVRLPQEDAVLTLLWITGFQEEETGGARGETASGAPGASAVSAAKFR